MKAYVQKILEKHGVLSYKASITADVLVESGMRSIFSHGVNNLDLLVIPSIKERGTNPDAFPEDITRDKSYPIRHIDARGDLGPVVVKSAVNRE